MYLSPNWLLSSVRSVKHFFRNALSRAHRGVLVPTSLWLLSHRFIATCHCRFLASFLKGKAWGKKFPLSTFHCNQLQHTHLACFKICQTTFDSILFKSLLSHVGQSSCRDVTEVTWPKPGIFSCRRRSCSKRRVCFHSNQYFNIPRENVTVSNEHACILNLIYIAQCKWHLRLKISVQGPFKNMWFYSSHDLFWIQCRRMETFMIKHIPLCYILTNFERLINAEQYMCNTEEKNIGGNSRNSILKIHSIASRECMTRLASHTERAVCLHNDRWPSCRGDSTPIFSGGHLKVFCNRYVHNSRQKRRIWS